VFCLFSASAGAIQVHMRHIAMMVVTILGIVMCVIFVSE